MLLSSAKYSIGRMSLCRIRLPLFSMKTGSCSSKVTLAWTVLGPLNKGLQC